MTKPIVPEKTVQAQVEQLLDYGRWTWMHPVTSLSYKGRHLTAFRGRRGFPDICAVRGTGAHARILFIECKSKRGRPDDDQKHWRELIQGAGVEYHLVGPDDLDPSMRDMLK